MHTFNSLKYRKKEGGRGKEGARERGRERGMKEEKEVNKNSNCSKY